MQLPAEPAERFEIADGVVALAPGVAALSGSGTLIVADAHLAYEDVVGGALPLWSTAEIIATVALAAERMRAREIVFLGDIVHGAHMSEGATRVVRASLDLLRERWAVTLVAGNHEGRSRAFRVLGETVEGCERDGWLLVHGDGAPVLGRRTIIGHIHPSLHLGGRSTAPAFVGSERLVVVPALTPYSPGLDVLSYEFSDAIGRWAVTCRDATVAVSAGERIYPFGSLSRLHDVIRARPRRVPGAIRRRRLSAG